MAPGCGDPIYLTSYVQGQNSCPDFPPTSADDPSTTPRSRLKGNYLFDCFTDLVLSYFPNFL